MAYSLIEQYKYDINWYFVDCFNRLCVAASAGGLLPDKIANNSERNDQFHRIVIELPERYEAKRNDRIENQIQSVNQENINVYYTNFEFFAKKGLYMFDKFNLSNPEDPIYILVAYPIYNHEIDAYPLDKKDLTLIPRIKVHINRHSGPINLLSYFNLL